VKRSLIKKRFVTVQGLLVTLGCCFLYLSLYLIWMRDLPMYLVIFIGLLMIFVVWHRAYQIVHDIKLLFFDSRYDSGNDECQITEWPTIAFIIPSCHEPFSVSKMTFDSIVRAPYRGKKEIIVVDNSKDKATEDFRCWKAYVESYSLIHFDSGISTLFLYNEEKGTLKPGNLDLGQKSFFESKYVVILDVDSTIPDNEPLLERSIADFETDDSLGFIQYRIRATNGHFNSLTNALAVSQDLLRLRMISRGYGGYKIFEGHNGMWRKSVLDDIGCWTEYYKGNIIVTEDILKSAHAYAAGYYGKSLNIVTGEWVPCSLKALESMWMRWMYGNCQVFFKSFKKIYSKKLTLIEKIDISYHITHHLVTFCFLFVVCLLQWTVQGPFANFFIITIGIIPQFIAATISYFVSVRKMKLPLIRKLQVLYAGFFMIETFIMYAQVRSDINFMLGVPQGWKVTEKGLETRVGWKATILNNSFYFTIAIFCIVFCFLSWVIHYNMAIHAISYHLALLFGNVNLLLCLILFRKERRTEDNTTESAAINCDNPVEILQPVNF